METNTQTQSSKSDFWMFIVFFGALMLINIYLIGTNKLVWGVEGFGIMLGAALTLGLYSFLYRDNPIFKMAEHLYVGVATAYYFVVDWYGVLLPDIGYATRDLIKQQMTIGNFGKLLLVLVPTVIGLMIYTRIVPKIAWMSRITFAVMIGFGMGMSIPISINAKLLKQIEPTMLPLWTGTGLDFGAIVIFVGVIATLIYFFFSLEHKGIIGWAAKVGIVFLMVSFGASFGFTVMARVSLLIERVNFLFGSWIPLIHG